ncbi:MAG: RluA family pseudouridine synthase [Candidatus Omnitrophica bacterium]|nr:RluA family pseudouridine synthase [Candidatus Omnitrophota bacterium]
MEFVVSNVDNGLRLDQFLARVLAERFSRSQVKKLIEAGEVHIGNQSISTAHYRVKPGEKIEIEWEERKGDETRAEAIPIDIVYEDQDLLVVNKPPGMVVHPAHGNPSHTLVNALLYHVRNLSEAGGSIRPGIVHRLDKDTSGLLVVAKNDAAHFSLARQFKDHHINRTYDAIVRGVVQHDEGEINEPVGRAFLNRKRVIVRPSGGKPASTYYQVKKRFAQATWLRAKPKTGRTHQIRVHLAHLGHPVLGDSLYGIKAMGINRQALHASELGFTHPRTKERMQFEAPLPEDLLALIRSLESRS